jgi:hypothetical protein
MKTWFCKSSDKSCQQDTSYHFCSEKFLCTLVAWMIQFGKFRRNINVKNKFICLNIWARTKMW